MALKVIMCNKVHFSFFMWKEIKGWRATNTEIERYIRVEGGQYRKSRNTTLVGAIQPEVGERESGRGGEKHMKV